MTSLLSRFYAVLLCSASVACSAAGADGALVFEADLAQEGAPAAAPVVYENQVMDGELFSAVQIAAERWIAATCLDIRVEGGGVKWSYEDVIKTPEDKDAQGVLGPDRVNPTYAHVKRTAIDQVKTATHEMGHRLHIGHVDGLELMNERNLVDRKLGLRFNHIGEVSLAAVCAVNDCGCFNPEPGPESDPSLIEVRQCQSIDSAGVSSWGPC